MNRVFKNLRVEKISRDFKFNKSWNIYSRGPSPVTNNALSVIVRRLNIAFINQVVSLEYVSSDCFLYIRKLLSHETNYSNTYARLDQIVGKDPELKHKYFTEILRKKNEIDLYLISNNTRTSPPQNPPIQA